MDYFLQAKHLGWENEADAIFVDNYFAEAFSWNTGSIKDVSHHTRILSLSSDFEMNSIDEKILNIVIITSCLAKDSVYRLRRLIAKLQCRRVAIFTSVSPELASGIDYSISRRKTHGGSIDNSDYAQLKEVFGHSAISIAYFPLHTIHLLQVCRHMFNAN